MTSKRAAFDPTVYVLIITDYIMIEAAARCERYIQNEADVDEQYDIALTTFVADVRNELASLFSYFRNFVSYSYALEYLATSIQRLESTELNALEKSHGTFTDEYDGLANQRALSAPDEFDLGLTDEEGTKVERVALIDTIVRLEGISKKNGKPYSFCVVKRNVKEKKTPSFACKKQRVSQLIPTGKGQTVKVKYEYPGNPCLGFDPDFSADVMHGETSIFTHTPKGKQSAVQSRTMRPHQMKY